MRGALPPLPRRRDGFMPNQAQKLMQFNSMAFNKAKKRRPTVKCFQNSFSAFRTSPGELERVREVRFLV
jgi:hypothetical protein